MSRSMSIRGYFLAKFTQTSVIVYVVDEAVVAYCVVARRRYVDAVIVV